MVCGIRLAIHWSEARETFVKMFIRVCRMKYFYRDNRFLWLGNRPCGGNFHFQFIHSLLGFLHNELQTHQETFLISFLVSDQKRLKES